MIGKCILTVAQLFSIGTALNTVDLQDHQKTL